jgi:hypothetical protein
VISSVFSDRSNPGFNGSVQHSVNVASDFKLKRLQPYHVPERSKIEINRQMKQLIDLGFIVPSK